MIKVIEIPADEVAQVVKVAAIIKDAIPSGVSLRAALVALCLVYIQGTVLAGWGDKAIKELVVELLKRERPN